MDRVHPGVARLVGRQPGGVGAHRREIGSHPKAGCGRQRREPIRTVVVLRGGAAPRPARRRGLGRDVRIRALPDQQAHRREIGGVGGAPERGRPFRVDEAAVPVAAPAVDHVPGVARQPRIRVGARLEQRPHHVQVGRLLEAVLLRLRKPGARLPLGVDRRPERRHAVEARRDVGVRAALDEHQGQVELGVDGRHQQRAGAVAGRDAVDVGPAVEERRRGGDVPLPRRVQQRRQPALGLDGRGAGVGIRLGLGNLAGEVALASRQHGGLDLARHRSGVARLERLQDAPLPSPGLRRQPAVGDEIDGLRRDFGIGPARQQQPDGVNPAAGRREDERRLAPGLLPRVHVGAAVEQRRERGHAAGGCRQVERSRSAGARRGHRRGPGREEHADRLPVAGGSGHVQRRVAADASCRVHRGAGVDQRPGHRRVVPFGGPVQGRHAVAVGGVGVLARRQQGAHRRKVARARRVGYRRRPGRSLGHGRGRRPERRAEPGAQDEQGGDHPTRPIR